MPHETGGRAFIIDTAARLFSQKGYPGVSIRDIAQACGLTNAALYYHFKNKEDLYLAVLRRSHEKALRGVAGRAALKGDLPARLMQLVRRYAEVMCGQRQSFQSLRRDLAHIDDARAGRLLGEIRADFMRPIQELIEAGQADGLIAAGDAKLLARLLHGMIIALTIEGTGRQPRLSASEAQTLVEVYLHGVVKKE